MLVQNKGDAHGAWIGLISNQKIAADVQFAVVFGVKTGRFFDVLVHRIFGDRQAVILLDPALFFERGRFQVNPDGLEFGQLFQGFNFLLKQSPVGKGKNVEQSLSPCDSNASCKWWLRFQLRCN